MPRNIIRTAIVSIVLATLGISTALAAEPVTGSINASGSGLDATYSASYSVPAGQDGYVEFRSTDDNGVAQELYRRLVFGPGSGTSPEVGMADLMGVGPWTLTLTFTPDGETFLQLTDPVVVEPVTDPVTIIDKPAAPPVIDDPLVKDDAHYAPVDTLAIDWTVNDDRSVTGIIMADFTTFPDGTVSITYPAPVDVYNPPTTAPKGARDACQKGKTWVDFNGDGYIVAKECKKV